MRHRNILITSSGKRVELLKEFKGELNSVYPEALVLTVDMNPIMSPACHVSHKTFSVPRCTSEDYPSILLDICVKNNVRLVVPTIDTELAVLPQNRLPQGNCLCRQKSCCGATTNCRWLHLSWVRPPFHACRLSPSRGWRPHPVQQCRGIYHDTLATVYKALASRLCCW